MRSAHSASSIEPMGLPLLVAPKGLALLLPPQRLIEAEDLLPGVLGMAEGDRVLVEEEVGKASDSEK